VVQRADFVSSLAKAELGPQPATLSPSFSSHSSIASSPSTTIIVAASELPPS
jgi:hypothetical protein